MRTIVRPRRTPFEGEPVRAVVTADCRGTRESIHLPPPETVGVELELDFQAPGGGEVLPGLEGWLLQSEHFKALTRDARTAYAPLIATSAKRYQRCHGGSMLTLNLYPRPDASPGECEGAYRAFMAECGRLGIFVIAVLDARDRDTYQPVPLHLHGLVIVPPGVSLPDINSIAALAREPGLKSRHRIEPIRTTKQIREPGLCYARRTVPMKGLVAWTRYMAGKLWEPNGLSTQRLLRTANVTTRQSQLHSLATVVRSRLSPLPPPPPELLEALTPPKRSRRSYGPQEARTCAAPGCTAPVTGKPTAQCCSAACRQRLKRARDASLLAGYSAATALAALHAFLLSPDDTTPEAIADEHHQDQAAPRPPVDPGLPARRHQPTGRHPRGQWSPGVAAAVDRLHGPPEGHHVYWGVHTKSRGAVGERPAGWLRRCGGTRVNCSLRPAGGVFPPSPWEGPDAMNVQAKTEVARTGAFRSSTGACGLGSALSAAPPDQLKPLVDLARGWPCSAATRGSTREPRPAVGAGRGAHAGPGGLTREAVPTVTRHGFTLSPRAVRGGGHATVRAGLHASATNPEVTS